MNCILMSIHPVYITKIMEGVKKYEFRKCKCSQPVDKIIIYATSPISMVVGEVEVLNILTGTPYDIWKRTSEFAGIQKEDFFKYYCGAGIAVAYELTNAIQYSEPLTIENYGLTRPPQAFCYL